MVHVGVWLVSINMFGGRFSVLRQYFQLFLLHGEGDDEAFLSFFVYAFLPQYSNFVFLDMNVVHFAFGLQRTTLPNSSSFALPAMARPAKTKTLARSRRLAAAFAEHGYPVDYRAARRPGGRACLGRWTETWAKDGVTWTSPCGRRFDSPDAAEAFLRALPRRRRRTLLAPPGTVPMRYGHTAEAEANVACLEALARL